MAYCGYCGETVLNGRVLRHHKREHKIVNLFPTSFVTVPNKAKIPSDYQPLTAECPSFCFCHAEAQTESKEEGSEAANDDEEVKEDDIKKFFSCLFCMSIHRNETYFWSHLCIHHRFPALFIRFNWTMLERVSKTNYYCGNCTRIYKKPDFYRHLKTVHKQSFRKIKKNLEKYRLLELGNHYFGDNK